MSLAWVCPLPTYSKRREVWSCVVHWKSVLSVGFFLNLSFTCLRVQTELSCRLPAYLNFYEITFLSVKWIWALVIWTQVNSHQSGKIEIYNLRIQGGFILTHGIDISQWIDQASDKNRGRIWHLFNHFILLLHLYLSWVLSVESNSCCKPLLILFYKNAFCSVKVLGSQ